MAIESINNVTVGVQQPLIRVFPEPILRRKNPTASDNAERGQLWVNEATHICFWHAGKVGKTNYWATQASTAGALNVGGTVTAGTGFVATTGNVTVSTGSINVTAGDIVAVAGDIEATNGNITAGGNMVAAGYVESATTIDATDDITTTAGSVVVSGAGEGVELPGGIKILTGSGAPANGLATAIGCLYIRDDAASAATRVYVATAIGAWTNISCAA